MTDSENIQRGEYRADYQRVQTQIDALEKAYAKEITAVRDSIGAVRDSKVSHKHFWAVLLVMVGVVGGMFTYISQQIHELQTYSRNQEVALARLTTILEHYDVTIEK